MCQWGTYFICECVLGGVKCTLYDVPGGVIVGDSGRVVGDSSGVIVGDSDLCCCAPVKRVMLLKHYLINSLCLSTSDSQTRHCPHRKVRKVESRERMQPARYLVD